MRGDLPSGAVTFLFTDIEGSTKLLHALGAESYAKALTEHRRLVRESFARHGGVEIDTQGDAFFVVFTDATEATRAAAESQEALAPGPISARMGLHTGVPHVTDEGYVGDVVHEGARIAAVGHGGQVLVSALTRELIQAEVTDLGEHRLKDIEAPVRIFQLGSTRFPPLKTISNTNLPHPASSFVGRELEIEEVVALLGGGVRLLTLTGPGGTGKTRLAIEAAAELVPGFKAGVFWVELAPLRDPTLVTEEVARTLGAQEGLAQHIGEREMLLVLDNLEQVIDAAPDLATLVERCPNLRMLVTSRELLRVRGEVEYPVAPLAEHEAIELFCARARMEPDEAVYELCRELDNLPLAVELAAARATVLSPAQILERLSQRLDLLKGGRDADPRQQTLRATIEWSYGLLGEEEQQLFARIAVFADGCTLDAAEAVADADLDTLQALVDKSLVRHTRERFWMLETIRELAAERLDESGEADAIRRRHAVWFLGLAERSRTLLRGGEQKAWLHRMFTEEGNIRDALTWAVDGGHAEIALRFAFALEVFWVRAFWWPDASRWLDLILRFDDPSRPILRARALATGGIFAATPEIAERRFAESIPALRKLEDEEGLAFALRGLAWLHLERGEFAEARAALEEAVELFAKLGHAVATRFVDLGTIAVRDGDHVGARRWFERALSAARDEGDAMGASGALQALGDLDLSREELDQAERRFRDALRIDVELGDVSAVESVRGLAEVAVRRGDFERAGRLWRIAERLAEERDPLPNLRPRWRFTQPQAEFLADADRRSFDRGWDAAETLSLDAVLISLAEGSGDSVEMHHRANSGQRWWGAAERT